MQTCEIGHENGDNAKYCSECDFPLKVSDREKIQYLKDKTEGVVNFEMDRDDLHILDLTGISALDSDISCLFPKLRHLKMKVDRRITNDFLSELHNLQYLTLNLNVIRKRARLSDELVEKIPKNITSLTISVDEYVMDEAVVDISEHLLKDLPHLKHLYIYCNPSQIKFLSEGHMDLDSIEFMGQDFDFIGTIKNFPSLTSIRVDFTVSTIDIDLINLPNLEKCIITLANTSKPVYIRSNNADYDLELNFEN